MVCNTNMKTNCQYWVDWNQYQFYTAEGRPTILMSPPCLKSQGCQLIPLYPVFFFCHVLSLFLSYPFLCLAHSPDLFFPKSPFSERQAVLCGSCFIFFERLGDEYFSWWYVQHMLPCGTGINNFVPLCI